MKDMTAASLSTANERTNMFGKSKYDAIFLMDIGEKGAGKDMSRGKKAAQQCQQEILHLTTKIFASQVNHIMVCFGAGGGTGSGSAVSLIEVAQKYARSIISSFFSSNCYPYPSAKH